MIVRRPHLPGGKKIPAFCASQRILLEAVARADPGAVVVSEEDSHSHTRTAQTVRFCDSLDGTRRYLAGSPDFAILLSACTDGTPVYSIAYFPATDILADADSTTLTIRRRAPAPERIGVHACYGDPPGLRAALDPDTAYLVDHYESTRALVDVALGDALAAVVTLCGHYAWDLAAPIHLINAAGGIVTDQDGQPIPLRSPHVHAEYVVLATMDRELHRNLLHALMTGGPR